MSLWLILLARSSDGQPAWAVRPVRWSAVFNILFFLWLAVYPIVRLNCDWVMTYSGREIYRVPDFTPTSSNKPFYILYFPFLKLESTFSNTTFSSPF